MRRLILSLAALSLLGAITGCRLVGGICDCYDYGCYPNCYGRCPHGTQKFAPIGHGGITAPAGASVEQLENNPTPAEGSGEQAPAALPNLRGTEPPM